MIYYSTHRPVTPGSFPKPAGNRIIEINNFDKRRFCTDIGREAWGYIDFEKPLSENIQKQYELTPAAEPKIGRPMTEFEICISQHMPVKVMAPNVPEIDGHIMILDGCRKMPEEGKFVILEGEEYAYTLFVDDTIILCPAR